MKILVADDESDLQMLVEMTLAEAGHEVVTVNNGEEAVQAARAQSFDLILLDAMMPEMDGLEAFKRLHENPETGSIPVAFMSAKCADGAIQEAIEKGALGCLNKPFDVDTLAEDIEKLFP